MSEVTNLINESKSLREEINSLNPVDHHSKPTIVVWGLMNAGKSYLLNMLSELWQCVGANTGDDEEHNYTIFAVNSH